MTSRRTDIIAASAAAAGWAGVWTETGPLAAGLGGAWPLPAAAVVVTQVLLLHGLMGALAAGLAGERLRRVDDGVAVGMLTSAWTTLVLLGFLGGATRDPVTPLVALSFAGLAALVVRSGAGRFALGLVVLAPAALAVGWLVASQQLAVGSGPSVLLVTVESARADRYGRVEPATPAFSGLARRGTHFALAIAGSPDAAQSAGQVLGLSTTGGDPLAVELRADGWTTAAFVSSSELARPTPLARGFNNYDDDLRWVRGLTRTSPGRLWSAVVAAPTTRRADNTVDRALRWIERADGPWFAWVHVNDPTAPYRPPVPWDERYTRGLDGHDPHAKGLPDLAARDGEVAEWLAGVTDPDWVRAQYDGEVAFAEQEVARLLKAVGDDTVVVLVGLTGESLGEGGRWLDGHHLHPERLEVPAVVAGPAVPAVVRDKPVSILEVPGWVRAARRGRDLPPPWLPAKAELRGPSGCEAVERLDDGWRETSCD